MTSAPSPIIVALDKIDAKRASELAEQLSPYIWGVKVNDLLVGEGLDIVCKLKKFTKVFADPKLYDIPNTVANTVNRLSSAGADLITVHASGGIKMIEAALKSKGDAQILGVTALTSLSSEETKEVYSLDAESTVQKLGQLALDAGADGLVCSPQELEVEFNKSRDFLRVTPGIRPSSANGSDDQTRIATPQEAVKAGASHIVIGRPITESECPETAAKNIFQDLGLAS